MAGADIQGRERLADAHGLERLDSRRGSLLEMVVEVGLVVVRPSGAQGVSQGLGALGPGLVHGELLPLGMERELLGSVADLAGRPEDPLGQQIADALPAGDNLDQPQHRLGVAEAQVDAVGVLQW